MLEYDRCGTVIHTVVEVEDLLEASLRGLRLAGHPGRAIIQSRLGDSLVPLLLSKSTLAVLH